MHFTNIRRQVQAEDSNITSNKTHNSMILAVYRHLRKVRTTLSRISYLWHTPIVETSPRTNFVHLHRPPSGPHVTLLLTSPGRAPWPCASATSAITCILFAARVPTYSGRETQSLAALHSCCAILFWPGSVIQVRSGLAALSFLAVPYGCHYVPLLLTAALRCQGIPPRP